MADEKKIITEVSEAVINLTGIFKGLQEVINTNLQQQGELITYMTELKKAIGSSKELRDFVKVSAELQKTQATLTKTQQAAIKIQSEQEKLRQQELKTQQATANALKAEETKKQALIRTEEASARQKARLTAEAKKAEKASRDASSAYQRESTRLLDLTKRAKDAAIQYGVNSKQARALRVEQQKLDKQIKSVDSSLGIHNRSVGNYGKAFGGAKNILGQFGVAMGGAQIIMKTFNGVIKNSQTAGDAWARTIGGIQGAFEGLFQAVGTGESLKGIINAMRNGAEAGREYAAAVDDLFEGAQGAALQTAEIETMIADAQIKRDKARAAFDRQEVLRQVDVIAELETRKLAIVTEEGNKRLAAERNNFEKRTNLSQEDFERFLKNYRQEEDLRNKALAFNKEILEEEKRLSSVRASINTQYSGMDAKQFNENKERLVKAGEERLQLLRDNTDKETQVYADLIDRWGGTTDEMIERYVNALTAIENAQRDSLKAQRRNEVARATMIRELDQMATSGQKENSEEVKEAEDEMLGIRLDHKKQYADEAAKISEDLKNKEIGDLKDIQKANEEAITAISKLNADNKEIREALQSGAKDFAIESVNAIFENRAQKYEDDLEANSKYYDELLSNQLLDEEQRSLLEAQRLEKENQIKADQRENEKKQFLFNQGFKVAEIVMDTFQKIAAIQATAALLAANPLTAAFAPFALAQIPIVKLTGGLAVGTVLAQSIPQFYKGTENSPEGLAWVGEKGTELKVSPDGKTSLTPGKPTLDYLEKGTKIIPHNELIEAVNNYSTASIIKEGGPVSSNDAMIAAALMELKKENKANNDSLLKALSNKPQQVDNAIDRMRKNALQSKIQGKKLYS